MKNRIRLDTVDDVKKFVAITNTIEEPVIITDGHFRVNGKSLLGLMYGMSEFDNLWVECEKDIYTHIKDFIIEISVEV